MYGCERMLHWSLPTRQSPCGRSGPLPWPSPPSRLSRRVYWSHRRTDDLEGSSPEGASEHVAFQRMAHFAGLAYLDEVGAPPPWLQHRQPGFGSGAGSCLVHMQAGSPGPQLGGLSRCMGGRHSSSCRLEAWLCKALQLATGSRQPARCSVGPRIHRCALCACRPRTCACTRGLGPGSRCAAPSSLTMCPTQP